MVKNSKGKVLLAQRGLNTTHDAGRWQAAVAGTVEKGETYRENVIKEMREEVGLKDIKITEGPKLRKREEWNYFVQWFVTTVDKPAEDFTIDENELVRLRWITRNELKRELHEHPEQFTNNGHWDFLEKM